MLFLSPLNMTASTRSTPTTIWPRHCGTPASSMLRWASRRASAAELGCGSITPEIGITANACNRSLHRHLVCGRDDRRRIERPVRASAACARCRNRRGKTWQSGGNPSIRSGNRRRQLPWFNSSLGCTRNAPDLLLLNGVVYTAWSSQCDAGNYHGWMIGYNAWGRRERCSKPPSSPTHRIGTRERSGKAARRRRRTPSGNIYVVSANGTFDANMGGSDFGESILKLSTGSESHGRGLFHALQCRCAERSRSGSGIERRAVAAGRDRKRGSSPLAGHRQQVRHGLLAGSR